MTATLLRGGRVLVGAEIRQGWSRSSPTGPQLLADGRELDADDEVDLLLERLGLSDVADVRAGELPTGQARFATSDAARSDDVEPSTARSTFTYAPPLRTRLPCSDAQAVCSPCSESS